MNLPATTMVPPKRLPLKDVACLMTPFDGRTPIITNLRLVMNNLHAAGLYKANDEASFESIRNRLMVGEEIRTTGASYQVLSGWREQVTPQPLPRVVDFRERLIDRSANVAQRVYGQVEAWEALERDRGGALTDPDLIALAMARGRKQVLDWIIENARGDGDFPWPEWSDEMPAETTTTDSKDTP